MKIKKTIIYLLILSSVTALLNSCKKDSVNNDKFELQQLGANNFMPSVWGIRGFNRAGTPIVHHDLDYLYEYDESSNTFTKLGNIVPNPAQIASAKIVQDGLGNYFYHSGNQGEVFVLNKTTNEWDIVSIAPGYKNQMVANTNGDILVYINNTTIGGIESFYKKTATSATWVKVLDMPINNPTQMAPQFLNNTGLAFFTSSNGPANKVDGEGSYNEVVLNTNTATFTTLYDKTDPENFAVLAPNNYGGFNSFHTTPDGTFYILITTKIGVTTALYKITSTSLPAKFIKITEYNHPPLENGSYITMRGCKVNEATGVVKFRSSCQFGLYSHKNLGVTATNSSALKVLQHDGAQNDLLASPNGTVYVHNYQGYLYKWK